MVTVTAGLTLFAALLLGDVPAKGPRPGAGAPVRAVLTRERYPWYDPASDRVKPVLPAPDFNGEWVYKTFKPVRDWLRSLNGTKVPGVGGLGDLVAVGLALLLLTLVLVGLLELLRRYRPVAIDPTGLASFRTGRAHRIEGLPAGVRLDAGDPWAEARRLRALGDLAGSVVHLFAHQLLTLDRAGQIRLVPGRTGRQLVRSVPDRRLRAAVEPTLRLFEVVYYGHRAPTPEAFEAAWSEAEVFQQLIGAEAGATP